MKHKQYWCPQPFKGKDLWFIHLWPSTVPAGSFQGFPISFSAFQNPPLRQVLLLTPVLRGSFQLKMAWGWFSIILSWGNGQEYLHQETSIVRKEHNQSSPKHHFCLSNPPNCVTKGEQAWLCLYLLYPLACLLAWPGGKAVVYRLSTLGGRSVVCQDSITFPFLSTYLPKFWNRAWSKSRIRTCF